MTPEIISKYKLNVLHANYNKKSTSLYKKYVELDSFVYIIPILP